MVDALIRAALLWSGLAGAGVALATGVQDPTVPPPAYRASQNGQAPQEAVPEPVHVQMIARAGARPMAVVNGRPVRVGERIDLDGKPVRVVAIRDESVVLDRDGKREIVSMTQRNGSRLVCATNSSNRTRCRTDAPGAQP